MVLKNYIELQEGIPARFHFTDYLIVEKDITDPLTRTTRTVRALQFTVDRLDGRELSSSFSVLAEKLAVQLEPFLVDNRFRGYEFEITKVGRGFQTRFSVRPIAVRPG